MPQIQLGNDVKMNNGIVLAQRTINSSGTHTLTSTSGPNSGHDAIISVDTETAAGATTINLPTDSSRESGRFFYIHDSTGSANTYNITVSGNGVNINGSSTFVLNENYNSVTIIYNGSTWNII